MSAIATDIRPGQLWHDKNHKYTGSDNLDMVHIILSAEMEDIGYVYKTAQFMWAGEGYCGAQIRKFLEEDIKKMIFIQSISVIKTFC